MYIYVYIYIYTYVYSLYHDMYIVISTTSQCLWSENLKEFWFMMSSYHLRSNMTFGSISHMASLDIWRSGQCSNLWRGLSSRKATWTFDFMVTWHQVTNKNYYVKTLRKPTTGKLDKLLLYGKRLASSKSYNEH